MYAQRGKSTTTLIVIIVVLAMMAAIAIPAWRNHSITQRVEAALKITDAAKLVVMEAATVHGGLAHIKASDLGYNPAGLINSYVAHVDIADGGLITITTKDTGAKPDLKLLLTPNQSNGNDSATINWTCSVLVGDASLAPAYCLKTNAAKAAPESSAPAASASSVRPS